MLRLDGRTLRSPLNLAFEGDSLSCGTGLPLGATPDQTWPAQLMARLAGQDVTYTNFATGGATVTDEATSRAATVDASLVAGRVNVLFLFIGTNDLKLLGLTGRQLYTNYSIYACDRQRAGWKVVPFTVLPRWNSTVPANFESERQVFNSYSRAASLGVVDVASDPRIGQQGQWADTAYYWDGTHLTLDGLAIVRDLAMLQLIGA